MFRLKRSRHFERWCLHAASVLLTLAFSHGQDSSRKPIEILSFQKMEYPPAADKARVSGTVVLEVHLAEDGSVVKAEALSGSPLLAVPAAENVRKWRFKAAGPAVTHLVFEFSNAGLCPTSCDSVFHVKRHNHVLIQKPLRW